MFKKLLMAVLLVAVSASAYAGSKWNNNNTEPVFNARTVVAKTAAYTATFSDDQINVAPSTATLTVTLPAISTLSTNGFGSKSYKILKTDTTGYAVLIAPNGTDTIDGTTGYAVTKQNDFVILSATSGGQADWKISYSDDVVNVDVTTGGIELGGGVNMRRNHSLDTATLTLTAEECGDVRMIATDAKIYTLPATIEGCEFTFVNTGADGAVLLSVDPVAADAVFGTVANAAADGVMTGSDGGVVTNTKATANKGDYITVIGDGVTGWFIVSGVGIWAGA